MNFENEVPNIYRTSLIQHIFQTLHALHTDNIDSDKCHFSAGIFLAHTQEYRNY